jgi:hypothetical protein
LDIDGRYSELSIDFYQSTSTIIEMQAIKKFFLSLSFLFGTILKRKREGKKE